MESRNPIFSRLGRADQRTWSTPTPTAQQLNDMYAVPSYAPPATRAMTMDDVVAKGFMTLAVLVVSGGLAWTLNLGRVSLAVAMAAAVVLWLVIQFKQRTNPALVLGFAACYGVAVGVVSHSYDLAIPGIVLQAVLGTMVAFAGTLAVYALKILRPTPKFTKFVIAAGFSAMALMLLNLVVSHFDHNGLGIRTDTPLGWIFSALMIVLGCFFLLLDFDQIERGVRSGVPEQYSWLMAFGLTLSLVWIYLEILRFISYFTSND